MKGMVYTTFAILASSLIFFIAMFPVTSTVETDTSDAIRIGEASFYLDSVLGDVERSTEIATRRGLTGATNYIIETGKGLDDAEEDLASAVVNGTINGVELNSTENASLDDWTRRVANLSEEAGYRLELEVANYSFEASGFHMESSKQVDARLKDPVTLASFNRSKTVEVGTAVEDVEDPLLLLRSEGRYTSTINNCSFDKPADLLGTGTQHSSPAVLGEAVVNPDDPAGVADKSGKILVVDADAHQETDVDQFAGVVSYGDSGSVGTEYVFNTGNLGVDTGEDLILSGEEVWKSNFEEMVFDDCYVPAEAPGLMERYENRLTEVDNGILTFVDVSSLPDALRYEGTSTGYKYFSQDIQGELHEVDGVTDRYGWFRLDDEDIGRWGLGSLAR